MTNLQAAHTLRKIADALDPPGPVKPSWPPCVITEYLDALLEKSELHIEIPTLEWVTHEKKLDDRTKALLG